MGDIVATTSNPVVIRTAYKNALPVVYDPPKPEKILFNKEHLFNSDLFGFGSIIGSITNKSSDMYAMLPVLEEKYGKDSEEVKLIESRLKQCCAAQSRQIDKTKIGRPVKGIPSVWINKQKITEEMDDEQIAQAELFNRCRVEKYPYFFKYLYDTARKDWKKYVDGCNKTAMQKFRKEVKQLKAQDVHSEEEKEFLTNFDKYAPLMDSNAPMNILCHYLENIDFDITRRIKESQAFDSSIYKNPDLRYTEEEYADITACIEREMKSYNELKKKGALDEVLAKSKMESIRDKLRYICSNRGVVANALVDYFYKEKESASKEILFTLYGTVISRNALKNAGGVAYFPMRDKEGDIIYLGDRYAVKEVRLNDII